MNWSKAEDLIVNWLMKWSFPSVLQLLHYAWFVSHFTTLVGSFCYLARVLEKKKQGFLDDGFWCYFTEISAVITYSIVTYRRYLIVITECLNPDKERHKNKLTLNISFSEVLKTENAQLLLFALLWLNTKPNIFKILPFGVYSFLNLSNYLLNKAFPEYQLSNAIIPLMSYLETPLLLSAAHLDGLIMVILAKECYETSNGYAFVLYMLIWALRIESSEASRCSIYTVLTVIDYLVFQDYNPQFLRSCWSKLEKIILILVSSTDTEDEDVESIYLYIDQFLHGTHSQEQSDSALFDKKLNHDIPERINLD